MDLISDNDCAKCVAFFLFLLILRIVVSLSGVIFCDLMIPLLLTCLESNLMERSRDVKEELGVFFYPLRGFELQFARRLSVSAEVRMMATAMELVFQLDGDQNPDLSYAFTIVLQRGLFWVNVIVFLVQYN